MSTKDTYPLSTRGKKVSWIFNLCAETLINCSWYSKLNKRNIPSVSRSNSCLYVVAASNSLYVVHVHCYCECMCASVHAGRFLDVVRLFHCGLWVSNTGHVVLTHWANQRPKIFICIWNTNISLEVSKAVASIFYFPGRAEQDTLEMPAHIQRSYLNDTVPRTHVCVNIDIIGDFREGWCVVVCIHHSDIDHNWLTFLHAIKRCYLWGKRMQWRRCINARAKEPLWQVNAFFWRDLKVP